MNAPHVGTVELCSRQVGAFEMCAKQERSMQTSIFETRAAELCITQRYPIEPSVVEIGVRQICAGQIGTFEVRTTKLESCQRRVLKACSSKIYPCEVEAFIGSIVPSATRDYGIQRRRDIVSELWIRHSRS